MNFSFWPFFWFGLPGRLLTKGSFYRAVPIGVSGGRDLGSVSGGAGGGGFPLENEGKGERGGEGGGTGKGTSKSMRKLCRNYPLQATLASP